MYSAINDRYAKCRLDEGSDKTLDFLKTFVGGINNLHSLDSTKKTSVIQFETNPIHRFVPSFMYSRKKQTLVFC